MDVILKLIPTKWLITIVLGLVGLVGILLIGTIVTIIGGGESNSKDIEYVGEYGGEIGAVTPEVLVHLPLVEKYAKIHGVEQYISIILALMQQETGGRGNDPMQSSESFCGRVGCITDKETSIDQGIKHFKAVMESAKGDIKLGLQSYNFGGGFIGFVMKNGGKYTFELAIKFSQLQYEKLKHTGSYHCLRPEAMVYQACYGDILYVDAVMKYVNTSIAVSSDGKSGNKVVNVGNKYIGHSTYLFGGGRNQTQIDLGLFDCSSFVHWAFKQVGIELGPLGWVSTETLKKVGKSVSVKKMKPGDLVFFDTYKIDGHVGIYIGNGQFIGSQTSTGVAIVRMTSGYWADVFNGRVRRI